MNPSSSNATADKAPGVSTSNENKSNIRFESPPLSVSRSGPSGLSRPRLGKVKRRLNSQNPRPPAIPETQSGIGYNPFRSVSESTNTVPASSSGSHIGTAVLGEFAKSGNEGFVFGANRNNPNESLSWGHVDSTGTSFGRGGIVEDFKNLKIGSGNEFLNATGGFFGSYTSGMSSSPAMGSERGGFVFGSGYKDAHSSIDESIVAELPEDIRKLNIKDAVNEKTQIGNANLGAKDNVRLGSESSDNVGGSFGRNIESELQNELRKLNINETREFDGFGSSTRVDLQNQLKKLNIKETTELGGFGSSTKVDDSFSTLPGQLKNLKINEPNAFANNMPTGYFGDKLFQNIDKPTDEQFTFQAGPHGKNASGYQAPSDQMKDNAKASGVAASSSAFSSTGTHFQTLGNNFEVPAMDRPDRRDEFIFTGKQACLGTPYVEFKTPNPQKSIFTGLNEKVEFSAKREIRDTRAKKKSGKQARPTKVQLWLQQDFVSRGSSSQENPEASDSYSPMDVSPYQETLADNRCSRENSVTSDESLGVDNYPATDSTPTVSVDAVDEDLTMETARLSINEIGATCRETKDEGFECPIDNSVGAEGPLEESASGAETESFKSATEEVDFVETEASLSSNVETHYSDGRAAFGFATNSEDINGPNFTFSASSAAQGQSSSSTHLHKKNNRLKVDQDTSNTIPNAKFPYASSSVQFIPVSGASLLLSPGRGQRGDQSNLLHKGVDESSADKGQDNKQESVSTSAATVAAQEACEKWRLR